MLLLLFKENIGAEVEISVLCAMNKQKSSALVNAVTESLRSREGKRG